MTRILFTSGPGLGHVHPMVPLALALADRGHDVRWAVAPEVCGRLQAAGFDVFPAGMGVDARHAEYRRRYPEAQALPPPERPDHAFPALFGEISPGPMLADLLPAMKAWHPSLVVHEAAELAAPIAAAAAGVPHVTHGFGALSPEHRVGAAGAAVARLWKELHLDPPPYGGSYDHLYLDIYPPGMRLPGRAHVPHVQDLRPVPFDAFPGDHEPLALLPGRPLVYVTFGTLFNDVGGTFAAAAAAVAALDVEVVVTVGPSADPAALGSIPGNVRVERYLPQTALLPRCSVVVSHGGSGTVLACLGLGIPQLCLPQAADQFINAGQSAAVGAALALVPGDASPAAIGEAVQRLLDDPSIRACAARVADEIAAMPGPAEIAAGLEALL